MTVLGEIFQELILEKEMKNSKNVSLTSHFVRSSDGETTTMTIKTATYQPLKYETNGH